MSLHIRSIIHPSTPPSTFLLHSSSFTQCQPQQHPSAPTELLTKFSSPLWCLYLCHSLPVAVLPPTAMLQSFTLLAATPSVVIIPSTSALFSLSSTTTQCCPPDSLCHCQSLLCRLNQCCLLNQFHLLLTLRYLLMNCFHHLPLLHPLPSSMLCGSACFTGSDVLPLPNSSPSFFWAGLVWVTLGQSVSPSGQPISFWVTL